MTDVVILPYEILELIFIKVKGFTLGRCRRVCKYWKEFIDSSEYLWHQKCRSEFKHASRIAKRKCGHQCNWYHIYRNLHQWSDLKNFDLELREFYTFSNKDNLHILDIDYGLLPVKGNRGTILYDTSTLENITACVSMSDTDCLKIANNDNVTIIQVQSGIFISRNVERPDVITEVFISGDGFVLTDNYLFLYINKDVYSIDLRCRDLSPNFIMTLEYSVKEICYSDNVLHLFIDYGYIVSLSWDSTDSCWKPSFKPINCPVEWIKQIKHICAVDKRNFVCYSRNLIKIQVEKYKHLYLEFPIITALYFYVDFILFGTIKGDILLYRLSSQPSGHNTSPTFETLVRLPEGEIALQLDVCERRSGPLIVISTLKKLYVIEVPFFPDEQQITESSFSSDRLNMYKRMREISDWTQKPTNNN